jgi:AtzE family amidohydrolase
MQLDPVITPEGDWRPASEIAQAVAAKKISALAVTEAALARIAQHNPVLNAFTDVTADRARATAKALDAAIAAGQSVGPLAGVPFAVKNLFDVTGLPTRAGSKINRDRPASTRDATLVERMEAAGAVLVGALNMGEYAYDFTGENIHDGPSRNPHDVTRMTGGSSGGSGGAVGGSLVPLALGSDTNGSIRVPSSFCGIFGLKPTYGRLSRARSFPFVASFDHLGPFARSVEDLALSYDAMQGPDAEDAACSTRAIEPVTALLDRISAALRIAAAGGYFRKNLFPEAQEAVARVTKALGVTRDIELPEVARARSAAYVISTVEGASLHLDRLRTRPNDFDPAVRDRLAGRRHGAGAAGRSRAEIPSLVPREGARTVWGCRCDHRAGDALHRAETGAGDFRARRRRTAGARQYRHPYPADLLHRSARGRRPRAARSDADRRADHCGAVAGRHRAARRLCFGAGRRRCRAPRKRVLTWKSICRTSSPKWAPPSHAMRRH